jgi:nitrous oxidase accessory protein NosD
MADGGLAEVSGNTVTGISFEGTDGTGVTVSDNVIRGGNQLDVGIDLGPGSPTIEGNEIGGVGIGIQVPDGAAPTIRSNSIEGVTTGIKVLGAATVPVIEGNRFCGNDQDLIVPDRSTLTLDPSNEVCPAD